jgi:hypothetical protein
MVLTDMQALACGGLSVYTKFCTPSTRVWHSHDFLASLEPLNLTQAIRTITHHWPHEGGQLSLRTMEGLTSVTNVPNRFFSARSDHAIRLTFRPREVGRHSATVNLDPESAATIRAKGRSIRITWYASDELEPAKYLVNSALAEVWMTGVFDVARNRHNRPKSLLLVQSSSLTAHDNWPDDRDRDVLRS